MTKPKLFLDMDNVLVDTLTVLNEADPSAYGVAKPDQIPGIFRDLPPMDGAVEAVGELAEVFELYILSTAPWHNPSAWQDKLLWLQEYFGQDEQSPFYKKVVLAHDKGLVHKTGGILLDDRPYHGASAWDDPEADSFWLQYGEDDRMVWDDQLVPYLKAVAEKAQTTHDLRTAITAANVNDLTLHGDVTHFEKATWE